MKVDVLPSHDRAVAKERMSRSSPIPSPRRRSPPWPTPGADQAAACRQCAEMVRERHGLEVSRMTVKRVLETQVAPCQTSRAPTEPPADRTVWAGMPSYIRGRPTQRLIPDEEILRLYVEERLDGDTIGYRAGCSAKTVLEIVRELGGVIQEHGKRRTLKLTDAEIIQRGTKTAPPVRRWPSRRLRRNPHLSRAAWQRRRGAHPHRKLGRNLRETKAGTDDEEARRRPVRL